MDTIFSFFRFEHYLKRNLIFSKTQYIYLAAIVGGGYLVALLFYILTNLSLFWIMKNVTLLIAISPCFFESSYTKYNGVMEYTFPVSSFERFLNLWVKYVIIIPLLILGLYYVLNVLTGALPVEILQSFSESMKLRNVDIHTIYILIAIQSVFLLGQLTFQKNAPLKIFLILIMFFVALMILMTTFMFIRFSGIVEIGSQHQFNNLSINGQEYFKDIMQYFLYFLFPVGMWIVSFFRIREKEI